MSSELVRVEFTQQEEAEAVMIAHVYRKATDIERVNVYCKEHPIKKSVVVNEWLKGTSNALPLDRRIQMLPKHVQKELLKYYSILDPRVAKAKTAVEAFSLLDGVKVALAIQHTKLFLV
jgi:hypothetical protein